MKKVILYICILINFCALAQQGSNFSIRVQSNQISKPNGVPFSVELNYVGTNVSSCTTQSAVINLGKLVYVPNINNLSTATASFIVDGNGDTIVTIVHLPSVAGSSRSVFIGAMFASGTTCNGTEVSITGELFQCGQSQSVASPIEVSASTPIVATAKIAQQTYYDQNQNQSFCMGKTVRYTVTLENHGKSGLNFKTPRVFVNLSNCANVIGVYKYNSYTPVDGSFQVGAGENNNQLLVWNVPDLNLDMQNDITFNSNLIYQIDVQYPCTNPSSCIGNAPLSVYLEGLTCNDEIIGSVDNNWDSINTNLIAQCAATACGVGGNPFASIGYNLYCPYGCTSEENSSVNISFTTPPLNPNYPNKQFKVELPDGIILQSAEINYGLPCNGIVKTYLDQNNQPTQMALAKTILFDVPCEDTPYSTNLSIIFKYSNPSAVQGGDQFIFKASVKSGETVVVPVMSHTAVVRACNAALRITKEVRKKLPANSLFYTELSGLPGEEFIYRVKINNTGAYKLDGTSITDILDPRFIYKGDFKIIYTSNQSVANLPDLNPAHTYTIEGVETIHVSTPAIGTNGTITLNNFDFPCSLSKYLIFEFRVQLRNNILVDDQITNVVRGVGSQSNIPTLSNTTSILVGSSAYIDSEMMVKCSGTQEWLKDFATVKNGQVVEIKLKVSNLGTIPMKLMDVLNLRPQNNDKFENSNIQRNGSIPFTINYACNEIPQITTNSTNPITSNSIYYNNDVNMTRPMICPSVTGTSNPSAVSCNNASNWLNVKFSNGTFLMNPGDFVEVVYKGIVQGGIGTLTNSFTYNVLRMDNSCMNSGVQVIKIENTEEGCTTNPPVECTYCSSFELTKKEKYLVSGWVREESINNPRAQYKKYEKSYIRVRFTDSTEEVIGTPFDFYPDGNIIDGWQRIIGEFVVPIQTDDMHVELVNDNDSSNEGALKIAYFDDIRVLPSKANMKSFVYDQRTQRLMAELDENNYSTFYEYDLEGGLIRIKKETEKGVFTIQETRSGSVIHKQ